MILPFGIFAVVQVLAGAWLIQAANRVKNSEDKTMVNFDNLLIGGVVMAIISFIIAFFMVRNAKKQMKAKE